MKVVLLNWNFNYHHVELPKTMNDNNDNNNTSVATVDTPPPAEDIAPDLEDDRRCGGNKAKNIRDALDIIGDDAKPADIVAWLRKERHLDCTPAYVSLIKTQYRNKPRQFSAQAYHAAKKLITITGSIQLAKNLLDTLDAENDYLQSVQERYESLKKELEQSIVDKSQLPRNERKELIQEVRIVRRQLAALKELNNNL